MSQHLYSNKNHKTGVKCELKFTVIISNILKRLEFSVFKTNSENIRLRHFNLHLRNKYGLIVMLSVFN